MEILKRMALQKGPEQLHMRQIYIDYYTCDSRPFEALESIYPILLIIKIKHCCYPERNIEWDVIKSPGGTRKFENI